MARLVAALMLGGALFGMTKGLIAQGSAFAVYGSGTMSCGVWTAQANNPAVRDGALSWVAGFVSGAGAVGVEIRKTDPAAIEAWVRQFCQQRPVVTLSEAAAAFVKTLRTP
jgi:hypothetical protein